MFRKLLVFTILLSMTLHCASRLGLLDKLYEQRHDIAYSIGLIEEVPIAMCNSDYDFSKSLKVEHHQKDSDNSAALVQAQEINLFFASVFVEVPSNNFISFRSASLFVEAAFINQDLDSIFHPPSVG